VSAACLVACNSPHSSAGEPPVARAGAPCTPDPRDTASANFACTPDKTQELVCDPATHKLRVWSACRGPKACSLDGEIVQCDQTTARAGEPCHPVDTHACTEDGGAELQCSQELAWTPQSPCKRVGCAVKSNAVFCE
jgi:hypothetical protein